MASKIFKWQIWCNEDSRFEYVWDVAEPANCPTNPAHTIDPTRTSIIEEISQNFPVSEVGTKMWVHSSTKPQHDGKKFYIQWIGAGDDIVTGKIGDGELLYLNLTPGVTSVHKDIKFHPKNGEVYIHEGYVSWETAGCGDYLDVVVMAEPSPLQPYQNRDLIIQPNGEVVYSPHGPGTGTHGFGGAPHLIDRLYLKEGNWDYDPENGLRPNFTQTGGYDIFAIEQVVYRLVTKIPVCGSTMTPFRLVSEDTTEIPKNYFLRVIATNKSNTTWGASVIITAYRENTYTPEEILG